MNLGGAMRSSAESLTRYGGISAVWPFWSVRLRGVDGTRRKTQYCFVDRPPEVYLSSIGRRPCLTPLGFVKGEGRAPSGIEQHGGKSPGIRARQSTGWHLSYFRETAILAPDMWRGSCARAGLSPTYVRLVSHTMAGKRPQSSGSRACVRDPLHP